MLLTGENKETRFYLLEILTDTFLLFGYGISNFYGNGRCMVFLILSNSYASYSQARVVPSTSYVPTRQKRSYEEDEDDMDDMDYQPQKQREPNGSIHPNQATAFSY